MTDEANLSGTAAEALQMARDLIMEAKGAEGDMAYVVSHLDDAEYWLDKLETALSALSHPEPVAQEAVKPVAWRTRLKPTGAKHWGNWHFGKMTADREGWDVQEQPLFAHPSPSPEQGEDDIVPILKAMVSNLWDKLDREAVKRAATTISALRARVAELDARATPQAGASEAQPVALFKCTYCDAVFDHDDELCGLEKCDMKPLATPPDSDAVRALREVQTIILYGDGDTSDRLNACETVVLATLSNQGSSSNGQ